MAPTAKLTRQALIHELEGLQEWGRALAEFPIQDEMALAEAVVTRLEWAHATTVVVRQLPRISVSVYADFARAGGQGRFLVGADLAGEVAIFRELLEAQLAVLAGAAAQLKKARTKPLNA